MNQAYERKKQAFNVSYRNLLLQTNITANERIVGPRILPGPKPKKTNEALQKLPPVLGMLISRNFNVCRPDCTKVLHWLFSSMKPLKR